MGLHGGVRVNRERHRYWSAYIAELADRMLLGHWDIDLSRKNPDDPDAGAGVDFLHGRHKATICLHKRFDDYPRAEQRHIVVHELAHLHLAPLRYHLTYQLGGGNDCEQQQRVRVEAGHTTHEEFAVDDLARIIAPSMPLPPKVKP
jgi:hypothetical protein